MPLTRSMNGWRCGSCLEWSHEERISDRHRLRFRARRLAQLRTVGGDAARACRTGRCERGRRHAGARLRRTPAHRIPAARPAGPADREVTARHPDDGRLRRGSTERPAPGASPSHCRARRAQRGRRSRVPGRGAGARTGGPDRLPVRVRPGRAAAVLRLPGLTRECHRAGPEPEPRRPRGPGRRTDQSALTGSRLPRRTAGNPLPRHPPGPL